VSQPFANGASVSRIWDGSEDSELIATFQYMADAEDFARAKLAHDAASSFKESAYAIACHYSAKLKIIRAQREKAAA
jgi:hypothetical protein